MPQLPDLPYQYRAQRSLRRQQATVAAMPLPHRFYEMAVEADKSRRQYSDIPRCMKKWPRRPGVSAAQQRVWAFVEDPQAPTNGKLGLQASLFSRYKTHA